MAQAASSHPWTPTIGDLARYVSRHSTLTRQGCPVRVVAEASGSRMRVEIIGRTGQPVCITVKSTNLHPLPPSLFDVLET